MINRAITRETLDRIDRTHDLRPQSRFWIPANDNQEGGRAA